MPANDFDLHPARKGGLLPKVDKPSLDLAHFLLGAPTGPVLPARPDVDDTPAAPYAMDRNDSWSDCVPAGWDHARQAIADLLGGDVSAYSDEVLLELYKTQNPDFDPAGSAETNGPGSSADGGMVIQLLLEELVRRGDILGFAQIDVADHEALLAGIYLGLAVLAGVQLQYAQVGEQFDAKLWDTVPGADIIGGHCVTFAGYRRQPVAITWATMVDLTEAFVRSQLTEAWFVLTKAHLDHPGFRDNFDVEGFAAAYTAITGRPFPVPVAPAPVPPAPTPDPAPPAPTPEPAPVPPAPVPDPAQGATFLVSDPALVARVQAAADRRGVSPDELVGELLAGGMNLVDALDGV